MKKIILLWFCICLFSLNRSIAQTDSTIHEALRELFSPLQRASCPAPFMYEYAAHMSNYAFFRPISYDTNASFNWWTIYAEMQHATYIKNMLPADTILSAQADDIINGDTILPSGVYVPGKIPLGLMDFDFNSIRDDAFDSANNGTWYFWTNDTIWDVPNRATDPFLINTFNPQRGTCLELFNFAPLAASTAFRDVTFTFDPSKFIFYNTIYSGNINNHPNPHRFQIDFGDGQGWQDVDPFIVAEFNIIYPSSGTYYIKAQVIVDNTVIKYSFSEFEVINNSLRRLPQKSFCFNGLNVGIYKGCRNDTLIKPIFWLSGIDPLEDTEIPDIYSDILSANLPILKNYDYDIVVVDYQYSKKDIRDNAMDVANLLEYFKQITDSTNQFVVIGHSMGGVVGRYALTYMESAAYKNRICQPCKLNREHNTRLFISFDAPHQGAVVPLAYQHITDWIYTVPRPILRSAGFMYTLLWKNAADVNKNMLKSTAVRQLLIQHRDTRNSNNEYTEHSKRNEFLVSLMDLNPGSGGWPLHCKRLAITNGLLDGSGQVGYNNLVIQPNQKLADFDMFLGVKILKYIPIPLYSVYDAEFRINPQGNGDIINMGMRFNMVQALVSTSSVSGLIYSLKGCLINLFKAKSCPCNTFGIGWPFVVEINNAIPWETYPGGQQEGATQIFNPGGNRNRKPWLYKNVINHNQTTGSFNINYSYGLRFLLAGVFDFNMTAEVKNFCFIPMQSALDYRGLDINNPLAQDFDILNETVNNNMLRTPFHTIVGWRTDLTRYPNLLNGINVDSGLLSNNRNHSNLRNDRLDLYNTTENQDLSWLTREIGETDMYLDNMSLNREALYHAQNTISAGKMQSPYYRYPGFVGSTPINGINSDSTGFIIDSFQTGRVEFRASQEIRLEPGFEARKGSRFIARIDTMYVCSYTLNQLQNMQPVVLQNADESSTEPFEEQIPEKGKIKIWPNPNNGSFYIFAENIQQIDCYDVTGRRIPVLKTQSSTGNKAGIYFQNTKPGLYLIQVKANNTIFTEKLIIK